jgi:SAM-dependent methyltransferase
LSNAFNTKKITVGCLGGGPGSDILGILKFLNFSSTSKNLEDLICTTYDKEQAWNETWYNVNNKIKGSFPFSTSFHFLPLDVTEPRALISTGKISDTDLFTMVYFLSEIYAYREDARDFFENLFDKARPGALLFFIDNSRRTFYDWFDQIATSNGLEIVSKKEYCSFQIEADEDKEALGYYFDNFGHPKLTAKIAYRIYRKMDGNLSWDDSDNSPF